MKSIIIVGSGIAGTLLARELLADEDCEVTMFEAGPSFEPGDRRIWLDQLLGDGDIYQPFMDDPRDENETFGLRGSRLLMKGGTTNHWGGLTPRFKPEDFELNSRTGFGVDWPINYDDLAPYYARAEILLGISGDSDNDDPPRYGAKFPFPHTDYTLGDTLVIDALKQMDIGYGHMSLARNGNRCITTGTCDYCPVNARYTALYDLGQLQAEYPDRLSLKTESPVTQVLMNGKKRARGVSILDVKSGESYSVEADSVIVCAGTIESCKLLLSSTNRDWPDGIGNESGHVGRHLIGHPVMFAMGVRPNNPDNVHQELGFTSLISRHFDSPEYQPKGKMWFSGRVGSTSSIEENILANMSRDEIDAQMKSEAMISLGGEMEQFEHPNNRVSLGNGTTRHGLRNTNIEVGTHDVNLQTRQEHVQTFVKILQTAGCSEDSIETGFANPDGAHASATCRMSESDADGVVDANLQVHGTDNLFICSNAVFPSIAAANPTLTMSALAVRLAEHLLG
ncbi:MAG: choline dehydrogenase-like flavoprotein [Pirellulaceae bacterium]|jgi:choline dehydrogenase-like flavoprotein